MVFLLTVMKTFCIMTHIVRHERLLHEILEDSVQGHNTRGRNRVARLQREDMVGCQNYIDFKQLANNRLIWRATGNNSRLVNFKERLFSFVYSTFTHVH